MSELRPLLALERLNARRLVGPLAVIIVGTLLFTGGVVWGSLGGIGRLGLRAGLAIMYAPPLLVILGALGLFAGDRMPLLGTLPARRRTIVTARFISLGVLTGLALVMALVQSLWSDMGVQSGISPVLAGLFVVCLVAPLAYRRGADQGQWSTALLVVAGVGLGIILFAGVVAAFLLQAGSFSGFVSSVFELGELALPYLFPGLYPDLTEWLVAVAVALPMSYAACVFIFEGRDL